MAGRAGQEPSVRFFIGKEMLEVMSTEFDAIERGFMGFQYVMNHTELIVKLLKHLQNGVRGQIVFDKGNFFSSSCVRQAKRCQELFEAGCEIRILKPHGGGFACMHTKSWL